MQTISIAVSAILIAAGLITAPALINNAKDLNTKQDLANIGTSQEAYLSNGGTYAPDIASLSTGTGINLRLSAGSTPGIVTGSDCYAAFAQSTSGSYFYRTSGSSAIGKLSPWPTTAPAGYPSKCSWPVAPFSSSGATYVNAMYNPSFETASSPVTVRTNFVPNPSFETSTTGAGFINSGTGSSFVTSGAQASIGVQSLLATWGDSPAADSGPAIGQIPVTAGTAYTFSADIRTSDYMTTGGLGMSAFGGGVPGGTVRGVTTAVVGAWVRVSVSFVAAVTSNATAFIGKANPVAVSGMQANVDAVLLEASPTLAPYFDGSTPASGDFTYGWTGTPNASASVQTALGVAGVYADGGRIGYQSTVGAVNGTHSLAVPTYPGTNDSFASIAGLMPTLAPNRTYTLVATVTLTSVQTGPLVLARGFRAYIDGAEVQFNYTETAPNAPGTYEVRATFTTGAGGIVYVFRLYNGAGPGNDPIYWDNVVLIPS